MLATSVSEILIVETVSKCQMRREPGLQLALLCIRPFVKAGVVSESEQYQLVDALIHSLTSVFLHAFP